MARTYPKVAPRQELRVSLSKEALIKSPSPGDEIIALI
jgi:hypothetical protein